VIAEIASQNVCVLYLESNTEYLTQAADEETLRNLTKQSIEKDVCVVTNELVKKALQAEEIYINDFTFVQVADFESDVVMAVDEEGNQYKIPYGTSLSSIFTTTQKITITEENWNGRTVYSVIYYPKAENKAEIIFNVSGSVVTVNSGNVVDANIIGNTISIVEGNDNYDSQSMIIITDSNGERNVMLLSEAAGYALSNEDMSYEICIVNRFGTELTFSMTVEKIDVTLDDDKNTEELSGVNKIVETNTVQDLSDEQENTDEVNSDANIDVNSSSINTNSTQNNDSIWTYKLNSNVQSNTDTSTKTVESNKTSNGLSVGAIVCISVGSALALALIGLIVVLIRKRFL
jgi:hypothetical protein